MAYSEYLADRVRNCLKENNAGFDEKQMFGGLSFFVDEKLCTGIYGEELLVRIPPEKQAEYLQNEDCHLLDDTGKSMKGFLLISPTGTDMDEDLDKWVKRCLAFNPKARSNKKSRPKE